MGVYFFMCVIRIEGCVHITSSAALLRGGEGSPMNYLRLIPSPLINKLSVSYSLSASKRVRVR